MSSDRVPDTIVATTAGCAVGNTIRDWRLSSRTSKGSGRSATGYDASSIGTATRGSPLKPSSASRLYNPMVRIATLSRTALSSPKRPSSKSRPSTRRPPARADHATFRRQSARARPEAGCARPATPMSELKHAVSGGGGTTVRLLERVARWLLWQFGFIVVIHLNLVD